MKEMKEGETFIDCVSGTEFTYSPSFIKDFRRVIYKVSRLGSLVIGYTLTRRTPYEIKIINALNGKVFEAVSKDIFNPKSILWDPRQCAYLYSKTEDMSTRDPIYYVNRHCYNTTFDYSAETNMDVYTKHAVEFSNKFNEKTKSLIPYSFGVEFETQEGTIPSDECFKAGLIPLRDGSINGFEYATIVLDSKNNGFERLKYITELLSKYTLSDPNCALHIHFGGFPLKLNYLYTVYMLCKRLEREIGSLVHYKTFNSGSYKSSGKDYCKKLPIFSSPKDFYEKLSERPYLGSLHQSHPRDSEGRHKWQIHQRYYFVNFINALFYGKNKTIELRCLSPTTNFNKIVGWIFLFSAILKYAENLCKGLPDCDSPEFKISYNFKEILAEVYPTEICKKLEVFIGDLKSLRYNQENNYNDFIGETTFLDSEYFKTQIL